MINLYHIKVFFPFKDFKSFWTGIDRLQLSRHFKERCMEKDIPIPTIDLLKGGAVFEVGVEGDRIRKIVVRIPCRNFPNEYALKHKDYIYVVSWDGKMVSAWENNHRDSHKSLDVAKYVKQP